MIHPQFLALRAEPSTETGQIVSVVVRELTNILFLYSLLVSL